MVDPGTAGYKHNAIDKFVETHFLKEEVEAERKPAKKKGKGNKDAKTKEAQMYKFTCLSCTREFRDVSNGKALGHKLLVEGCGCKHCTNPKVWGSGHV